MNKKEWDLACKNKTANHHFDGACRRLQKSLRYNSDPNAIHRHHLRDTEEQRKYNDEHYELWGFEIDENGKEHFEYGKYIVFLTQDEHNAIHAQSDETKAKRSASLLGHKVSDKTRKQISESNKKRFENNPLIKREISERLKGKHLSEEHRRHLSENHADFSGENHPFYGKHHSEESRKSMSESHKGNNYGYVGENHWLHGKTGPGTPHYGMKVSDEGRRHISEALKGRKDSDETKRKKSISARNRQPITEEVRENMSNAQKKAVGLRKEAYYNFKSAGGELTWNEFQKAIKNCSLDMYTYISK